jgi:uncharacterized protein YodC (DUF2158 family)
MLNDMKKPISARFKYSDLRKIGAAFPWAAKPLIGDTVTLNSGCPRMLIVDLDYARSDIVMTGWSVAGAQAEMEISYKCLRPWTDADNYP